MRPSRDLIVGLGLLGLGACAVGPEYRPPEVPAPAQWMAAPATAGPREEPASAPGAGTTAPAGWWTGYRDPTLDWLVDQALLRGFSVRQAATRIAAARAEQAATAAGSLPAIEAGAGASRQENTFAGIAPERDFSLLLAGFDARWELDVFGRRARREEAAGARVEAAISDRAAASLVLAAEVVRVYWQLRTAEIQTGLVEQSRAVARQLEDLAQKRLDAGAGTRLEVLAAAARTERISSNLPAFTARRALAERQLEQLLALPPGALTPRLGEPAGTAPEMLEDALLTPAEVLARRPDIRRAERRLAEAVAAQGAAMADRYPRFSFAILMGLANTSIGNLFSSSSRSLLAGGEVMMPLLDGGRLRAAVDLSSAQVAAATLTYEETALGALHEVEAALIRLLGESRRVQNLEAVIGYLESELRLVERRQARGASDRGEVLAVKLRLNAARQQRAQAGGLLRTYTSALMKALGVGLPAGPSAAPAAAG